MQIGTLKTIKRLQQGDILVEADGQIYSTKLQQFSELGGIAIKITPHRSLYTCKGVIRSREVSACGIEKIVRQLTLQGATGATIESVKEGSVIRCKITVVLSRPLQYIKAGYIRIPVELYIPNLYASTNSKTTDMAATPVMAPRSV